MVAVLVLWVWRDVGKDDVGRDKTFADDCVVSCWTLGNVAFLVAKEVVRKLQRSQNIWGS